MAANYSDDDDDGEMDCLATAMHGLGIDGMGNEVTLEQQNILLNHIILPHYLPESTSPKFHQTELRMFDEIYKTVMDLHLSNTNGIPERTVELFRSMHKIHVENGMTSKDVSNEINALQPGDTFAMFVRRQNSAFLIYMPPDENTVNANQQNVIVATFPGRLHPNEVYKWNCDVQVIFIRK